MGSGRNPGQINEGNSMTKKTANPAACKLTGSEIDCIVSDHKCNEFFSGLVQRAAGLNAIEARS